MLGARVSHYEVVEKLGQGGMGVVYKAHDTHLGRFVALKVLSPEAISNPERRRRLVQEARAASALNHPNIITVHDIDTDGDTTFIAMEYVDGRTLDQLIGTRGLRVGEVLRYAVQIADALAAAHAAGIVHRDLKPSNIMVTDKGLVKVLDFGLAKLTGQTPDGAGEGEPTVSIQNAVLTEEGAILGTVAYMSPEQAEGKKVDARSDIFSFGVVLYEMLTGHRAFTGETKMSTLAAILHHDPKPAGEIVNGLPRELERVLGHCFRKDPGRRLQHMEDLKVLLEELKQESESGKLAAPTGPAPRGRRGYLVAAILAAAVLTAGASWYFMRRASPPAAPQALTVVPLTSYPGDESSPTFSPDGRQVAFSWNGEKQDNFDIYVRLVDGGTPLRLTTDPAREFVPAWSPDARWIAFVRGPRAGDRSGVHLIAPLGGPERKLADALASFLAWSPDAQSVAWAEPPGGAEEGSIVSVSVATGQKRQLTSSPPGNFGDRSFAFSPDGRTLAFARFTTSSSADLYLVNLSGGEPQRITKEESPILGMTWTPDGRDLVYSVRGTFRRIEAGAPHAKPEPLPALGDNASFPVISRPGPGLPARLAFQRASQDSNVYRLEAGPTVSPALLIASTRRDDCPQFSPDGTRIAFSSERSGRGEIWTSDSNGANPVQLTSIPDATSHSCRWSPDGRFIAFSSISRGNRDIFVSPAGGGGPRRLTIEPSEEGRPSWSRDGRWIYFYSIRGGPHQIWKTPAEGGPAVPVTKGGGHEAFESPDGGTLYFTKLDRLGTGLWSMPAAGGEETQILEGDGVGSGYWAVADKGIYFVDFSARLPHPVKFFDFGSRQVRDTGITVGRPVSRAMPGFSVTRDGRSMLVAMTEQLGSDLMLVENFR